MVRYTLVFVVVDLPPRGVDAKLAKIAKEALVVSAWWSVFSTYIPYHTLPGM